MFRFFSVQEIKYAQKCCQKTYIPLNALNRKYPLLIFSVFSLLLNSLISQVNNIQIYNINTLRYIEECILIFQCFIVLSKQYCFIKKLHNGLLCNSNKRKQILISHMYMDCFFLKYTHLNNFFLMITFSFKLNSNLPIVVILIYSII